MLVLTHILAVPVEEFLVPLASGGLFTGILVVLASVMARALGARDPH